MNTRIFVLILLGAAAPLCHAGVVELSPDLYLVVRDSRVENAGDLKIAAIAEANKFAKAAGKVAAPISGVLSVLGPVLKEYEYQFRLMTREQALAAKPSLADAVIAVTGGDGCRAPDASAVAASLPQLFGIEAPQGVASLVGAKPQLELKAVPFAPDIGTNVTLTPPSATSAQ